MASRYNEILKSERYQPLPIDLIMKAGLIKEAETDKFISDLNLDKIANIQTSNSWDKQKVKATIDEANKTLRDISIYDVTTPEGQQKIKGLIGELQSNEDLYGALKRTEAFNKQLEWASKNPKDYYEPNAYADYYKDYKLFEQTGDKEAGKRLSQYTPILPKQNTEDDLLKIYTALGESTIEGLTFDYRTGTYYTSDGKIPKRIKDAMDNLLSPDSRRQFENEYEYYDGLKKTFADADQYILSKLGNIANALGTEKKKYETKPGEYDEYGNKKDKEESGVANMFFDHILNPNVKNIITKDLDGIVGTMDSNTGIFRFVTQEDDVMDFAKALNLTEEQNKVVQYGQEYIPKLNMVTFEKKMNPTTIATNLEKIGELLGKKITFDKITYGRSISEGTAEIPKEIVVDVTDKNGVITKTKVKDLIEEVKQNYLLPLEEKMKEAGINIGEGSRMKFKNEYEKIVGVSNLQIMEAMGAKFPYKTTAEFLPDIVDNKTIVDNTIFIRGNLLIPKEDFDADIKANSNSSAEGMKKQNLLKTRTIHGKDGSSTEYYLIPYNKSIGQVPNELDIMSPVETAYNENVLGKDILYKNYKTVQRKHNEGVYKLTYNAYKDSAIKQFDAINKTSPIDMDEVISNFAKEVPNDSYLLEELKHQKRKIDKIEDEGEKKAQTAILYSILKNSSEDKESVYDYLGARIQREELQLDNNKNGQRFNGANDIKINGAVKQFVESIFNQEGYNRLILNSVSRDEKENKSVKGVKNSYHLTGRAVDVSFTGLPDRIGKTLTEKEVDELMEELKGLIGYGIKSITKEPKKNHYHIEFDETQFQNNLNNAGR